MAATLTTGDTSFDCTSNFTSKSVLTVTYHFHTTATPSVAARLHRTSRARATQITTDAIDVMRAQGARVQTVSLRRVLPRRFAPTISCGKRQRSAGNRTDRRRFDCTCKCKPPIPWSQVVFAGTLVTYPTARPRCTRSSHLHRSDDFGIATGKER